MSAIRHSLLLAGALCALATAAQKPRAPSPAGEWRPCRAGEIQASKAVGDSLYAALEAFRLEVEMVSYRSQTDAQPFERERAVLLKDRTRFRSEIGELLTVQDERLRVLVDEEDRSIMVTDPVDPQDQFQADFSQVVLTLPAACAVRRTAEGTEFRLTMPEGSEQDRVHVLYDARGWPRRTETFWRKALPESPNDPRSVAYKPRLVLDYGVPVPLKPGQSGGATNPWAIVEQGPEGIAGTGRWAGHEVVDVRLKPTKR